MSNFSEQLYGSGLGWVSVNGWSQEDEFISRWFQWPSESNVMDKYISLRNDEDVYQSVAVYAERTRTESTPATLHTVYADADICEPSKFKLPPSIIVQTSPAHADDEPCPPRDRAGIEHCNGHYHVYWVLDDSYPAKRVQEISRRVYEAHKNEGCDSGWTLTKILRAPNTSNTKWDPAYEIGDPVYTGEIYSIEDFYEPYGTPEEINDGVYDLGAVPELVAPDSAELRSLEEYIERSGTTDLYLNKVKGDGVSWSDRQWRLMHELFRYGCEPTEVFSLAWYAACNKYDPIHAGELTQSGVPIPKRKEPEKFLWSRVQEVWGQHLSETPTRQIEDEAAEVEIAGLELLTPEERTRIADNPTFIDKFVDWCAHRSPGHARDYSKALAWGVLSCAHGNKAYLDSQYGPIPLNLWINIAGDSTRSRKSTVMNLALKVVQGFESQELESIHIGSDATVEPLITLLGTRDRMTSLLTIDEVNGFYKELSSRQYRIGTKEKFTSLYDGNVPIVLRATKGAGNENRASTVFNMWGVGIYNSIIRTLTREDFMSGYMYRTTWAISPPIPYTEGSSNYLNNTDEIGRDDEQFYALVRELSDRSTRADKDHPFGFRLTPDALARANAFVNKLHLFVQMSDDTALDDGIDRLRDSVIKCAALLSFHNGKKAIEDFEMLVAIEQGERWFKAFQKVFRDVSGSEFSRDCDELENYIATGQGRQRSESAIFKRFSYRTTEFNDISSSLVKQGRIRRVNKQDKWECL